MKKGRASTGRFVHRPVMADVGVVGDELGSSLYRLLEGGQGRLEFAPVAHLLKDRQAARGSVAPLGAKGWLRLSMCQIASVSRPTCGPSASPASPSPLASCVLS